MNNKILYYYLRKDLSSPYYVGVGNPNRIHCSHSRRNGSEIKPKERERRVIIKQNLSEKEMFELEKLHIKLWGREIDGGVLLNETLGGEGKPGGKPSIGFTGRKHSEESKERISERTKGENNPRFGVKLSPEVKQKCGRGKSHFKGSGNPNSKSYKFFNDKGEEFIICGGFKTFCKEKKLTFSTMSSRILYKREGIGRNGWGVIPL